MSQPPLILYIARERLIAGRAPPLQIFNTLRGICEAGASVRFITPWPAWLVRRRFVKLTGHSVPRSLSIVSVGPGPDLPLLSRMWPTTHWPGLRARLRRYLQRTASTGTVIYTRNRQVAADIAGPDVAPVVFECHEFRSRSAPQLSKKDEHEEAIRKIEDQEQRAMRNIAALTTLTQCLADDMQAAYPAFGRPVRVVPDGVDPDLFSLAARERNPIAGRFVYVGALMPWKGLATAIRALALVPQATLDICGGQAGSKDWEALVALAKETGTFERITLHGSLPQRQLVPILSAATAGLLPLNGEFAIAARYTSPLKLFEYLAAGLPVIASDLPALREVIRHGQEGLLFLDRDAAGLAAAMRQLIDQTEFAQQLSARAVERAKDFTWSARGRQIVELCTQLAVNT